MANCATTKTDQNKPAIFERKVLGRKTKRSREFRIKCKPRSRRTVWQKNKHNRSLFKISWLGWAGHVWRSEGPIGWAKSWKPNKERPIGLPRQRWKDRIIEDASSFGVNNGEELARDRDEWRQLVVTAMDLNGP